MVYLFIFLILILILLGSVFYYYKLINRFFLLFNKKCSKRKMIFFVIIVLTLVSINLFNIVGLFFIHFIIISLVVDFLFLIFKKYINNNLFKFMYKSCLFSFFLTFLLFVCGFINIKSVVETSYTIYTDKEIGQDIKILLFTDIHYGSIFDKNDLVKLKKKLDVVDADIVVLGGDIVDESTSKSEMEYIFSVLGNINVKYGIYYIYGNHDQQNYKKEPSYSDEELREAILSNKIKILKDSYMRINDNIIIAGRNDYSLGRNSISDFLIESDEDDYIIMVDHQPVEYDENVSFGVDLIMSGHTHAGQIFPAEIFINLLHTADLSYGYKKFDNMDAIVSSGVAGWRYSFRTSRHSEYVVIDLKQSK